MFVNTKSPSVKKLLGATMAVPALAAAGVAATATPAAAAWADCPSGFNCWWAGNGGGGTRWQANANDTNLGAVNTLSGYNRSSQGNRNCGYSQTDYLGDMNYSRPPGDQAQYSLRTIRSTKWVAGHLACPE